MVVDTISKEFTKKLLYKDSNKLNNKNITTVANILVTSTSNYLPLVGEDIPNILVDVESNLDDFCKMNNINISQIFRCFIQIIIYIKIFKFIF